MADRGAISSLPVTFWVARTGEGGTVLPECIAAGVVALRYRTVGDARTATAAEIEAGLAIAGDRTALGRVRSMLEDFVSSVEVGDVVVTPHAPSREVWFGTVTGDYRYDERTPVAGYRHLRDVDWTGSIGRDHLPAGRRSQVDRPPVLYRLPDGRGGRPWPSGWPQPTGAARPARRPGVGGLRAAGRRRVSWRPPSAPRAGCARRRWGSTAAGAGTVPRAEREGDAGKVPPCRRTSSRSGSAS